MGLSVTFKSVGVAAHDAVIASLHRLLVIPAMGAAGRMLQLFSAAFCS
jgi:hypothetical protein